MPTSGIKNREINAPQAPDPLGQGPDGTRLRLRRHKSEVLSPQWYQEIANLEPVVFTKNDPRIRRAPFRYEVAPYPSHQVQAPAKPAKPLSHHIFAKTLKGMLWGVKIGSTLSIICGLLTWLNPALAPITGVIALVAPVVCGAIGAAIGLVTSLCKHYFGKPAVVVPQLAPQPLSHALEHREDCDLAEELALTHARGRTQHQEYGPLSHWHRDRLQQSINTDDHDLAATAALESPRVAATASIQQAQEFRATR
jgi:hypothetical protein